MKKITIIILVLTCTILASCNCINNDDANETVNFQEINITDIFNIEQIQLPDNLSRICKSYSFDYNVEGIIVEGQISIPNNSHSDTPSKCLLYNRGGNSNFGFLTETDTARISVATDRIVIASQYRTQDEFGGADLKDVLKLIDFCETFNFADMTDFTVAGVSRGGMMTYMTARADSRVKRIISISGVSDLTNAYYERDDMQIMLKNFIGGSPEELPTEYEKRSAIYWADEITIPTLIIHSKGDNRASYSDAETMYNTLKNQGTDVTMKTYDDSTHGLHKEDAKIIADWLINT